MIVVDTHCHAGVNWFDPVELLLYQMSLNGVDRAVLIQHAGTFDNGYLLECASRFPGRFAVVVIVDPALADAPSRLEEWAQRGAVGVRLWATTRSPGTDPLAVWRKASELGLVVSCQGTVEEFAAADFDHLVSELPGLSIVIEHLAGQGRGAQPPYSTFKKALNLATVWKLPVIFVCEHNLWASGVPSSYAISVEDISARAASYNIPGITIDGNDVIAVYQAAADAAERARRGDGPTLIECKTYRWHAHNVQRGNVQDPRPPEEIEAWKRRDPITAFGSRLLEMGMTDGEVLEHLHLRVQERVAEALAYAKASPSPEPEDALTGVFAP